jgi:YbbR domain-containing protein
VDYKKLLARIAEKWPAKVLSVAVAILLFAFHRMGDLQERFFSVPLQLDMNGTLIPAASYPRNIRITLRGDANSIYHVAEEDIEARLDLTEYSEPGVYKVPVQLNRKGTAAEAETLEISLEPMEISLELDTRMSKYVPLSPDFEGFLETGYEMVSYTLEPNQVVIDGPMKLLTGIPELFTESIDRRNRSGDFTLRVRIMNPNPMVIIRGDGTAEFSAFVRERIMIKNFEELPIGVTGLREDLEALLDPPVAALRIRGRQNDLELLTGETLLTVDCSALAEPGFYELPLTVSPGPGLEAERTDPETIRVELVRKGEEDPG